MGGRATWAIAGRSLLRARGYIESFAFAAIGLAVVLAPAYAPALLLLGAVVAALFAVSRNHVAELTNLRYFAAPLYGREVARAHAIVTCVRVLAAGILAALLLLFAVTAPSGAPAWQRLFIYIIAQLVTAMVASLGCLRTGRQRWLYVGFAVDAGLIVDALGFSGTILALSAATLAAAALGFTALRALGETLARYDPVD